MSYLLESLGRGLLNRLLEAFERQLPGGRDDDADRLETRFVASPTSADLALRLGKARLRDMRLTDARRAFEAALAIPGGAHLAAIGLACVNDELGRLDQAVALLTDAARFDARDPALAFGAGLCEERRGDATAAARWYRRAVELCPTLRNAHERLAAIAVHAGDWSEATRRYQMLSELEPGDLDILLTRATLELHAGRPIEAIDAFQQALLVEPDLSDSVLDEVEELEREGQLAAAIESAERLIEQYPGVTEFHVHLADLYVKAAEDDRAVEQYSVALELQPMFLEATVKLGTQHLRRGRYRDAAVAFNRAVELNDRLLVGFVGLGVAQDAAGRSRDAQATFALAASLAPNSTLLLAETARLHVKSERAGRGSFDYGESTGPNHATDTDACLTECIQRHRRALARHRDDAELHYRYGVLVRQLGAVEEAIGALERATAIHPSFGKALIKLGLCLRECGRLAEATDAFRRALLTPPDAIGLHYSLALMFAQRNQFELAMERYADADRDGEVGLRRSIALSLQSLGLVDRAEATWRALSEVSFEPSTLPAARFASSGSV